MIALPALELSVGLAMAMTAFFAALLVRRWQQERTAQRDGAILAAITRSYLRRVAGKHDEDDQADWRDRHKLQAVSHIHLLLRGQERDRLMQMAELDGLLRATLRRSRSWRAARRIDAIRLLQHFGSEACIGRLRELFARDPKKTVRLEAAFALASIHALPPPRETIRILGMFDRNSNRLDRALLRASATQYKDQLIMLLDDRMPEEKRALIIDALGWSEDPTVLPTLTMASQSENPEVRSSALRAAAKLGHRDAAPWVIACLGDPVDFVRIQAANCCASLALEEAVPPLRALLEDPDLWVRLRAEHALDVIEHHWPDDQAQGVAA